MYRTSATLDQQGQQQLESDRKMIRLKALNTPRLILRPATEADRLNLIALEADSEVMLYLNGGLPVPVEGDSSGDFLTPRGGEPEVLVAIERGTGAFIGWFALFDDGNVNGLKTAELGYRLRRESWGCGFATEGARELVAYAFDSLGVDQIIAKIMVSNLGSRSVLKKLGFKHMKTEFSPQTWPIPGKELGEATYQLCRNSIKKEGKHPLQSMTQHLPSAGLG